MNLRAKRLGVDLATDTGHTNRGTWAVNLWLGSEAESHAYWLEAARQVRRELRGRPRVCEQQGAALRARNLLADRLLTEVSRATPMVEPGLYSDLLRLALAEVDWDQLAERFLDLAE